ncbi:hypothetical protein MJ561_02980 [Klebsiella pneumoniae]|nr:hypothetical protein MJ561_02980 [Klebsiella pneumoniae]
MPLQPDDHFLRFCLNGHFLAIYALNSTSKRHNGQNRFFPPVSNDAKSLASYSGGATYNEATPTPNGELA